MNFFRKIKNFVILTGYFCNSYLRINLFFFFLRMRVSFIFFPTTRKIERDNLFIKRIFVMK